MQVAIDRNNPAEAPATWGDDRRKMAVHIRPEVVAQLAREAFLAFKSVPKRGLEIGGILLGRIEIQDNVLKLSIEGFENVESEHRLGPSYLLSDADAARFQAAVRRNGTNVVGFYRSQTRSLDQRTDEHDVEWLRCSLHLNCGVFLLLGPLAHTATIFYREQDELTKVHEFALTTCGSQLALEARTGNGARQRGEARRVRVTSQQPKMAAIAEGTSQSPRKSRDPRRMLVILIAALIASVAFNLLHRPARAANVAAAFLDLRVLRHGSVLKISWDRGSPVLDKAIRGVLFVRDGDKLNYTDLSVAQLKTGSLDYRTTSGDLTFRLDVYATPPDATGSLQLVGSPSAPATVPPVTTAAIERPTRSVPSANPTVPRRPDVPPYMSNMGPRIPSLAAPVHVEPVAPMSEKPASVPAPARIGTPPVGRQQAADERPPMTEVRTEVVSGSRWESFLGSVPVLRKLKKQDLTAAPVATLETAPVLKPADTRDLTGPAYVDVRLEVDASGKVTNADVSKYGDPPNFNLANASLAAVRHWVFRPARLGAVAVSSEVLVHFRFTAAPIESK